MTAVARPQSKEESSEAGLRVNPEAFVRLYDENWPLIHNYFAIRVGSAADREDLVAEVFCRAWRMLLIRSIPEADQPRWLIGIARNVLREHWRAASADESLEALRLKDRHPRSSDFRSQLIFRSDLEKALERLTKHERDVLALQFGLGLSQREISHITSLSLTNISTLVYRALRKLRRELSGVT